MSKRFLQILFTFTGAVVCAILVVTIDWWLYILTGKTAIKGLMDWIDTTPISDYIL